MIAIFVIAALDQGLSEVIENPKIMFFQVWIFVAARLLNKPHQSLPTLLFTFFFYLQVYEAESWLRVTVVKSIL